PRALVSAWAGVVGRRRSWRRRGARSRSAARPKLGAFCCESRAARMRRRGLWSLACPLAFDLDRACGLTPTSVERLAGVVVLESRAVDVGYSVGDPHVVGVA